MKVPFYKILLVLHRYLGLLAAVPLLLLGLSGAVLVFENELDRALNPAHWSVTPQGPRLSWRELIASVRKSFPNDPAGSLRLPLDDTTAAEVTLKSGWMVSVDPYTGRVMHARRRDQILTTKIHQFHTRLLLPGWGEKITGTASLVLLLLSATALPLWWRRKSIAIRWSAPWRRVNYDSHYSLGILGLLPWVVLGLTGAAIAFESVVRPALYGVTGSKPAPAPTLKSTVPKAPPGTKPPPIPPDSALFFATETALPGAKVTVLSLPQSPSGAYVAYMKFPEDHTPAGRSRVGLDQYSGRVLWLENARTAPAGTRLWNLNRPIHTGDLWGWPTRILACLASFVLGLQSLSGVWMWLARPWRKTRAASGASTVTPGPSDPDPAPIKT